MNNKKLLVSLFFLFVAFLFVQAQRPEAIRYTGDPNFKLRKSQGCNGAEAGTFKLKGAPTNSSNNIKFLCPGDTIILTHDGNYKFVDPTPATQPGIGYVYFDCKPTAEAKTLAELLADRCVNKKSPILVNGLPVNQKGGLWLAKGPFNDGNIRFYNDGFQQTAFNNGKPIQIWFAPVTLDNFAPGAAQTDFENTNTIPGACIDLNIDSAFSIVYLNALKLSNLTGTNNGINNYAGTFTATGGLPEFDTSSNYTEVTIVNDRDANAIGRLINGPAKNGKPMQFSVPKPGKYSITIKDANGCSVTSAITIAEDPADVKINCVDGKIGDQICIPIKLGKIPNLAAAQFTFAFNPQAMTFVKAQNLNPKLGSDVSQVLITNTISQGFIKFFWIDLNLDAHDLTAEETLIEFCFTLKGPPGQTKVNIVENPGPNFPKFELSNPDGNSLPASSASNFNCSVNISPSSNLDAFYSQCGQQLYAIPSSGQGPYTFYYSAVGSNTILDSIKTNITSTSVRIFNNRSPGRYVLTLKDSTGASVVDTFTLDPNIRDISLDLSNIINESCKGGDGRIIVIPSGGTPSYRFDWSTGSISDRIERLKAGTYYVTVTDAQGCMVRDSVVLNTERPRSAITIDRQPFCNTISDGRASPDFTNILGVRPFTFEWIGKGTKIGNAFTSLGEGRIGLIIADSKGCTDTSYANVQALKSVTAEIAIDSVQCFNASDGRITIRNRKFSDGTALSLDSVLITNVSNGSITKYTAAVARHDQIKSGLYYINVKDQSGCNFLDTVDIYQPELLDTAKIEVKPESCRPGNDGSISIQMKGGTGPYIYTWGDVNQNTNTRTGLKEGSYSVNVKDQNGCVASFTNNLLSFNFTKTTIPVTIDTIPIKCFDQATTLTAKPAPGFNIESYRWSNGDTTVTAKNIKANVPVIIEVTDNNGCKGFDTVQLSQPGELKVQGITNIPNPCPGLSQGVLRVDSISGGTGPYTFSINNGPTQNFGQFSRLASGKYTVTIVDANQCPALVVNADLIEPPKIVALFDTLAFRGVKCAGTGDCSGEARLLLSGGTDPNRNFQVRWQSGEIIQDSVAAIANKLCAGNQEVTVFDGNGCSTKLNFSISSPDAITRDPLRTISKDILCNGQNNGSITYIPTGGTSPYKLAWNDGDTNSIRAGLTVGKYTVSVTDLNNCRFVDSIILLQPDALQVTLDTLKLRAITCPNSNDGQIGVKVSGGNNGDIKYSWTPSLPDSNFIRNIPPGVYSVIVSDEKGCTDTLSNISMNAPPKKELGIMPVFTPKCAGDTASVFISSVSGGNGASYSFAINNGNSIPSASKAFLRAGTYQFSVFDRKGCSLDTTITVVDPSKFNIDLGADKKIRLGDTLRISTISNSPISKVDWSEGVICLSTDCSIVKIGPIKNTSLKANAIDQNGCKATDDLNITVDTKRSVFIPNAFKPDQIGVNQDFRVYTGPGVISINYARVYNRWGDVMTEVRNLAPDAGGAIIWDGRYRGRPAPSGVYIYIIEIEFTDGEKLVYRGDLTLIR